MLAIRPQGFAAGHKQMNIRRFPEDLFRQLRRGMHARLATIEDQQHPPPLKKGRDAGRRTRRLYRDPKSGGEAADKQF